MIELGILLPMISLALLFVLVATHAWQRSVTTTIYVVAVAVAMNCYAHCSYQLAGAVIVAGAIVALARTVINTEKDRLIKRGDRCSGCSS